MKTKKAQVALTAVIMLGIILGIVVYSQAHPYEILVKMGDKHNEILSTYTEAEAARSYIQSSARYSIYQALYDQGKFGGFQETDCEDLEFLDSTLNLENREEPLRTFKCYEEEGKGDELCKLYDLYSEFNSCDEDVCLNEVMHKFVCERNEIGEIWYYEKNNEQGQCEDADCCENDDCTKGDLAGNICFDDCKSGEIKILGSEVYFKSNKATCELFFGEEQIKDTHIICDETNDFCKDYDMYLDKCDYEACEFNKDLEVTYEQKKERTCVTSDCDYTEEGYTVWYNPETVEISECVNYPDITETFADVILLRLFEDNFNNYLSIYDVSDTRTLYDSVNYDFKIEETDTGFDVIGAPKQEKISIFNLDTEQIDTIVSESKLVLENEEFKFKYSVEPCFRISVNYLLNYDEIINKTKECVEAKDCKSLNDKEYAGFKWKVTEDDEDYILFDLTPIDGENFLVYDSDSGITEAKPIIKFAVKY